MDVRRGCRSQMVGSARSWDKMAWFVVLFVFGGLSGCGSDPTPGPEPSQTLSVQIPGDGTPDVYFNGKKIGSGVDLNLDLSSPPAGDRLLVAQIPGHEAIWANFITETGGKAHPTGSTGEIRIDSRTTAAAYLQLLPDFFGDLGETNAVVSEVIWQTPELDNLAQWLEAHADTTDPTSSSEFASIYHDVGLKVRDNLNAAADKIASSIGTIPLNLKLAVTKYGPWGVGPDGVYFKTDYSTAPDGKSAMLEYLHHGNVKFPGTGTEVGVSLFALDVIAFFTEIDKHAFSAGGKPTDMNIDRVWPFKPGTNKFTLVKAATSLEMVDVLSFISDSVIKDAYLGPLADAGGFTPTPPTIALDRYGAYSVHFITGANGGGPRWDFVNQNAELRSLWFRATLINICKFALKAAAATGALDPKDTGWVGPFLKVATETFVQKLPLETLQPSAQQVKDAAVAVRDAAIEFFKARLGTDDIATNLVGKFFQTTSKIAKKALEGGAVISNGLQAFALGTQAALPPVESLVITAGKWEDCASDTDCTADAQCQADSLCHVKANNTITVFASGELSPRGIAVDATSVYWTNSNAGSIAKCGISGCVKPSLLESGQTSPASIAVDATSVYWTSGATVMKDALGVSGGNPIALASMQVALRALVADTTSIYWASGVDGTVMKCALNGCGGSPTPLASAQGAVNGIAVSATSVYWTSDNKGIVLKCALNGCGGNPTTLASAQGHPNGIAVNATGVYWTNLVDGTVMKCALNGCGGSPTILASAQQAPDRIAVDAANVYWGTVGSVMKCAIGGCGGKPSIHAPVQGMVGGIALDAMSVYWTDNVTGTVSKIAK